MKKLKADWSQEVPATIQSTIFCLPHLLSKNIKIKIHRTIILPLLSVVNPDPEIRSCSTVETSLILTLPPSKKLKSQSSNIVLGGYSNIRWLMMMISKKCKCHHTPLFHYPWKRENQNSYLIYFAHLQYNSPLLLSSCIPFTLYKVCRLNHPLISYIFPLYFFSGNDTSNKPYMTLINLANIFSSEDTLLRISNLKLVFYVTLLHSFKTLQYKTKLTLPVFQQLKSVEFFNRISKTDRKQEQYAETWTSFEQKVQCWIKRTWWNMFFSDKPSL